MSHGEAASSSSSDVQRQSQSTDGESAQEPSSSVEQPGTSGTGDQQEEDLARCPICQFIEAGECKEPHQTWVACRNEAKAAGKDYIEECQDHFKAFLQCAIVHRDYYEPFLEMLGGISEEGEAEGQGEQSDAAPPEAAPAAVPPGDKQP